MIKMRLIIYRSGNPDAMAKQMSLSIPDGRYFEPKYKIFPDGEYPLMTNITVITLSPSNWVRQIRKAWKENRHAMSK